MINRLHHFDYNGLQTNYRNLIVIVICIFGAQISPEYTFLAVFPLRTSLEDAHYIPPPRCLGCLDLGASHLVAFGVSLPSGCRG